jgi:hypothetical protein
MQYICQLVCLIRQEHDMSRFLGPLLEHLLCGTIEQLFDSGVKPFV